MFSATDLVNTEAMPKAVPAAAASSTLCSTTRCIRCAARNSAATAAPVTTNSRLRSPASPTAASTAPRHAAAPARRRTKTAAIGSANTMVRAPSGWTRLSGPYASATTCSSAPRPFSPTATHQPPRRSGAYRRSGVLAATLSWTIAPPAYATADTRQSRTDSASALISSTMPDPSALFLRPQVVTSHTPDVVREYAACPFHQRSATPTVPHGHRVDPYGDGLFAMCEAVGRGFGSGRGGSVQFPF